MKNKNKLLPLTMFNILKFIMGKASVNKTYTKKEVDKLIKSGKAVVGKIGTKNGGDDAVYIDNEAYVYNEKKKLFIAVLKEVSAGATKPTRSEMESIHGKAIQKGYCDGQGNFIVTEDTVDGKVVKYPLHEVVKGWEKKFPYVKFENSHVEVSEKEEK